MHVNSSSQTLQAILLQQQQQQDAIQSGNPLNSTANGALQLVQAAANTAASLAQTATPAASSGVSTLGNTLNTFA
ncbi:MAG: hypothetical protein ABW154_09405 [Dyella sp.]